MKNYSSTPSGQNQYCPHFARNETTEQPRKVLLSKQAGWSTGTITAPRMWTIRQVAKTGILPENALRQMVKNGTCPHIMVGNRALINFDKLIAKLEAC